MQIKRLSEWEKSLAPIIDDMDGRPLHIHALLANHPALLEAWWPLRMYLVNGGDLEQRHCELVILRIAAHMGDWYEWASHVVRGLDNGLSLEEIENVRNRDSKWSEVDGLLLTVVDEHLKGMYTTIGCVINTWGLELDEHIAARLPDAAAAEDFRRA